MSTNFFDALLAAAACVPKTASIGVLALWLHWWGHLSHEMDNTANTGTLQLRLISGNAVEHVMPADLPVLIL